MVRRRAGRGRAARRAAIPVYSCFKGAARSRSGFESDAFTQQVVLIVSRVIGTARASVPLKKSCSIIQPINSDRSLNQCIAADETDDDLRSGAWPDESRRN